MPVGNKQEIPDATYMLGLSRLNSSLLTSSQEIHSQGRFSALITSWDWCKDADELTLLELPLPECVC